MTEIKYVSIKNEDEELTFSSFFFSNIIKEVIHTMTGLELNEEIVTLESMKAFKAQLSGVILLSGNKNIMISLSMSTATATTLVAFMTGLQYQGINEEDLNDGVSELANVVGGKIKAKALIGNNHFKSLTPFTIKGNDHYITQRDNVLILVKKFHINSIEILAKVFQL